MQPDLIYEIMPRHEIESQFADMVINIKTPSVPQIGCKMDGTTDDTAAFQNILNSNPNRKILIPHDGVLLITSPVVVTQQIILEAEGGTITDIYAGNQAISRIKYTGTGTFLTIDGTAAPTAGNIYPSGSRVSYLSIEGTSAADCAIKVNQRGCASTSMRNVTLENVFAFNFTNGWGFELHEVYSPILINCNVQNCGGVALLVNAHATTFIGGSLEQCAFGIYNKNSRPVSFNGTTIEGISASRPNCNIPSGFTVWNSWAGSDNPRPTISSYEGIGIVNFGGQVIIDKVYFEGNDWNVIGEYQSHISLINSYNEADSNTIGSIDFAGLYLEVKGNRFTGDPIKNHIYLESSIPANYCYIKENERYTVSDGKLINSFTGYAGIFESQELWGRTINHYNTKMSVDTITLHPATPSASWNQLYVDPNDGKLKFLDNTGATRIVNLT